ncbi:DUF6716 putative glycosyltransferase [Billgrantia endophytica]|uniref:Uncharacterized protein n=1 Tax=Billgrantia endophytica TaxID=2033802 RepID=A0A2N7TY08_9GAMM|nr:DUF6716 putative glycosyltransferase [Halomonas endophytica]PMR73049.1 hypothetical protein C1H69_18900 [Halomonas endophytica]
MPKVLLPFYDDSTLFFARRMYDGLMAKGVQAVIGHHVSSENYVGISERQRLVSLGDIEPALLDTNFFTPSGGMAEFEAVICCKITKEIRALLESDYRLRRNRPCFLAFQPGLEFTPLIGFRNRKQFDAIFLNNELSRKRYLAEMEVGFQQHVSWGHPYMVKPAHLRQDTGGDIYFFTQALSPRTFDARHHIVEVLVAMAEAYPERKVVLKLRHLPNENTEHVHKERYDYISLLPNSLPSNLVYSDCSMVEALESASIAMTCTSTAAMDAISAGLPTMVYLDYVENYLDPMMYPMRKLMGGSGVLSSLTQVLNLDAKHAESTWVEQNFRASDLYDEVLSVISSFKQEGSNQGCLQCQPRYENT